MEKVKMSPRERIRRMGRSCNQINIDINKLLSNVDAVVDRSVIYAGVMRFTVLDGGYTIKSPKYKVLILMNSNIYCYRKIFKNNKFDINSYSSIIEFNNSKDAINAWKDYISDNICESVNYNLTL